MKKPGMQTEQNKGNVCELLFTGLPVNSNVCESI